MSGIICELTVRDNDRPVTDGVCRFESRRGLNPSPYFGWKQVVDWTLALLLAFPAIPLLMALVVIVRLTSRGPAIFAQSRVGKNGRNFTMYKIRTMCQDAEAATGPVWGQARDPRTTPVGSALRTLHLDELPQLWNVLKGEMSLIGPRPERPEFVPVLSEAIPTYPDRLLVRPGITGLAQLNLPPDTDLESVCRKLVLDCEYIERAGLWLDCRILACTALRIFKLQASWLMGCLALQRDATISATLERTVRTTAPWTGLSPCPSRSCSSRAAFSAPAMEPAAGNSTLSVSHSAHSNEIKRKKSQNCRSAPERPAAKRTADT